MKESKVKVHQGRNVRFFRNAKDMKQEVFAEKIGATQPTVTKIERQSIIEETMLLKCSNALGISVDILKEFEPEKMIDNYLVDHFDKSQSTNNVFSISEDSSSFINYHYFIEKLMEMNQKNTELYERLLQSEKEKVVFFEKMFAEKHVSG